MKKIVKILSASVIATLLYSSTAFAWVPSLRATINTNGGHDLSINPYTYITHTYSWDGLYSSFSGSFYAKPGYSKIYNNVVYKSDSLKTYYTNSDYNTTASIDIDTSMESASDYIHVNVLH